MTWKKANGKSTERNQARHGHGRGGQLVFGESKCELAGADGRIVCLSGWIFECSTVELAEADGGKRIVSGPIERAVRPCPKCLSPDVAREHMRDRFAAQRGDVILRAPNPDKTLDNFNVHGVLEQYVSTVRQYVKMFETNTSGAGLYFCGPTGRGKSHLANGCWLELVTAYPSLRGAMVTGAGLFDMAVALWDDDFDVRDDAREAKKEMQRCDLLVLDDVGTEGKRADGTKSENFLRELYSILDRRYQYRLPTLVTTEKTRMSLSDAGELGQRLARRLVERMTVLDFDAVPSYSGVEHAAAQVQQAPARDGRAAAAGKDELPF